MTTTEHPTIAGTMPTAQIPGAIAWRIATNSLATLKAAAKTRPNLAALRLTFEPSGTVTARCTDAFVLVEQRDAVPESADATFLLDLASVEWLAKAKAADRHPVELIGRELNDRGEWARVACDRGTESRLADAMHSAVPDDDAMTRLHPTDTEHAHTLSVAAFTPDLLARLATIRNVDGKPATAAVFDLATAKRNDEGEIYGPVVVRFPNACTAVLMMPTRR